MEKIWFIFQEAGFSPPKATDIFPGAYLYPTGKGMLRGKYRGLVVQNHRLQAHFLQPALAGKSHQLQLVGHSLKTGRKEGAADLGVFMCSVLSVKGSFVRRLTVVAFWVDYATKQGIISI